MKVSEIFLGFGSVSVEHKNRNIFNYLALWLDEGKNTSNLFQTFCLEVCSVFFTLSTF